MADEARSDEVVVLRAAANRLEKLVAVLEKAEGDMSSKTYEQKVARLVQEACAVSYMTALRWVREHEAANPSDMPKEARALAIVEARKT